MPENSRTTDKLAIRPAPPYCPELVMDHTLDELKAQRVFRYEPSMISESLMRAGRQPRIAVEMGGNRISSAIVEPAGNGFSHVDYREHVAKKGDGFYDFLYQVAADAERMGLPVAISFAGPVREGKPQTAPNMAILFEHLQTCCSGDIQEMFATPVTTFNDAVASLLYTVMEASQQYPHTRNMLLQIAGSGYGTAVFRDGLVTSAEGGHLKAPPELNKFGQSGNCGVHNDGRTCVEMLAGGEPGIHETMLRLTSRDLSGPEFSDRVLSGDKLALEVADIAAAVYAHGIAGFNNAFFSGQGIDKVLCHGGVWKTPGLPERVRELVKIYTLGQFEPDMYRSPNAGMAGLYGAYIGAFMMDKGLWQPA